MINYNGEEFSDLIQDKVIVDFYANWCGPCKMIAPELEKVESSVKVVKVDVDEFENLAKEYGVMSIPTLILLENGEVKDTSVGYISKEELLEFIG